jgi:hypothetical protein
MTTSPGFSFHRLTHPPGFPETFHSFVFYFEEANTLDFHIKANLPPGFLFVN